MSTKSLVTANFAPKEDTSNKNMGIFVVDHAPIKMSILENFAPFFINTAATGNAPYKGPAAADPNRNAKMIPFILESSPIYRTISSLGTQTSNNPNRIKIGGRTTSISLKL